MNKDEIIGKRVKSLMKYLRISQTCIARDIFRNRTRQYVADRVNGKKSFTALELKALAILFHLPNFDKSYLLEEEKFKTLIF